MRIIAGQFKGARLFTPRGDWLRPTTDIVREFIFSFLGSHVVDASVLDLFAGTGSLGLEALSREAGSVTFVDRSARAVALIRRNMHKVNARATVFHMHVDSFLKKAVRQNDRYDLVFCDPPYNYDPVGDILTLICNDVLQKEGILIYESGSKKQSPVVEGVGMKSKVFGDTRITFYHG